MLNTQLFKLNFFLEVLQNVFKYVPIFLLLNIRPLEQIQFYNADISVTFNFSCFLQVVFT